MGGTRNQRRLAAILAADVVGYTRLVEQDTDGTVEAWKVARDDVIKPVVDKKSGHIIKFTGDGFLVEFPSIQDAVACAIELQEALASSPLNFRMGINLGDITDDGGDVHGEGVNIAARLEALAEPGGICISGDVYNQVRNRIKAAFLDMGEQQVKHVSQPVRTYMIAPNTQSTSEQTALPAQALALPDKPSIAVLPFDNMSGDPEQNYFSDGITEDIITGLSKFRWFFVTARNSTFAYKGTSPDIKQVGRELGVRYILEGSVRKSGNRLRITAQLIEAETGNHIWAEKYDRKLEDVFELQDEMTQTICAALEPELAGSERDRAFRKPTENLDAWGLYQRGISRIWQLSRVALDEGEAFFHEAIARDASFGMAHGYLAFAEYGRLIYNWTDDRTETIRSGMAHARTALSIDQKDFFAHFSLGRIYTIAGDHQSAIRELETSIEINPNFAQGYFGLAAAYAFSGDAKRTIENASKAIRLSPSDPLLGPFLTYRGAWGYFRECDFDRAIIDLEKASDLPKAQFMSFMLLAHVYAAVGRIEDGKRSLDQARKLEPNLSIEWVKAIFASMKDGLEEILNDLRKLGLE